MERQPDETAVVWIEDVRRLPYVLEAIDHTHTHYCIRPRRRHYGEEGLPLGRMVGYTILHRKAKPRSYSIKDQIIRPGLLTRRVFWLRETNSGSSYKAKPDEGVRPEDIEEQFGGVPQANPELWWERSKVLRVVSLEEEVAKERRDLLFDLAGRVGWSLAKVGEEYVVGREGWHRLCYEGDEEVLEQAEKVLSDFRRWLPTAD